MCKKRIRILLFTTMLTLITISSISSKVESHSISRAQAKTLDYTVQKGDTVSQIAEKYKPKYKKLDKYIVEIQVLSNVHEHIEPGQKLLIPIEK